ncbi:MAG: hypothetical protein KAX87_07945, partial [Nitrospira sp.]|nr:hypothetical protein [Nitrospira sp.]
AAGNASHGATLLPLLTAAENAARRRSRLERVLNVPQGYASGAFVACGLAGERFEQPDYQIQ